MSQTSEQEAAATGQKSNRRRRRRTTLRTRLTAAFVLQLVVVVGAVGFLSFSDGEASVNDVAGQLRRELSERVQQKLESYVAVPFRINSTNADAFAQGILSFTEYREAARFFWRQMVEYDTVAYISVGTADGLFFGIKRMNDGTLQLRVRHAQDTGGALQSWELDGDGNPTSVQPRASRPNYDPRLRPWFTRGMAAEKTVWTGIESYYSAPNELATGPVTPIFKDGKVIGVISSDLQLSQLSRYMRNMKLGVTGVAFIVEASGTLVASSTQDRITAEVAGRATPIEASQSGNDKIRNAIRLLEDKVGGLGSLTTTSHYSYEANGQRHFLTAVPYSGTQGIDWITVITVPESDFLHRISESRTLTLKLCLVALLFSMLVSLGIARSITKPLVRLTEVARRLRSGNLDVAFDTRSSDEIGTLAFTMNDMVEGLRDRDFIRNAFGRYLSPELARRFMQDRDSLRLGGHIEQVTLLMSDLRGFTALSERLGPERMVQLLNRYLGVMTSVILAHRGTIIEFIGDAILVVFGAPIREEDDPQRAVRCAVAMQQAMSAINEESASQEIPTLEMGIGIHTGQVVAGNIGCESHVKYGVVGEPVNLTSRIESLTLGGQVLLSHATYEQVMDSVETRDPKLVSLKGVSGSLRVYELVATRGPDALRVPAPDTSGMVEVDLPCEIYAFHGFEMDIVPAKATVARLGTRRVDVMCPSALPPLAKVMVRIQLAEGLWTGDIYATVTDDDATAAAPHGMAAFQLALTSLSEPDRASIDGLTAGHS